MDGGHGGQQAVEAGGGDGGGEMAGSLGRVEEMGPGPYPDVELGEPVQATGLAGSVLFAHYLLAHNIGGHDGPEEAGPRQTVYYRLEADGHRERWREAVTSPLLEFA